MPPVQSVVCALHRMLSVAGLMSPLWQPWYRAPAYLLGIISGVVWVEWGEALQRLAADTRRKRINATFSALAFAAACTLL